MKQPDREPTVAHNCHGKTKSHGTTNLTHGKTMPSEGKKKNNSRQHTINSRQNEINSRYNTHYSRQNRENELVSGWSAVVICFSNGMSCNSNTLLARKPPFLVHCSLSRAHDVLQRLWFVSRSKCQLLQTVVKVHFLISYLHHF